MQKIAEGRGRIGSAPLGSRGGLELPQGCSTDAAGRRTDPIHRGRVEHARPALSSLVQICGEREDVGEILKNCKKGVKWL